MESQLDWQGGRQKQKRQYSGNWLQKWQRSKICHSWPSCPQGFYQGSQGPQSSLHVELYPNQQTRWCSLKFHWNQDGKVGQDATGQIVYKHIDHVLWQENCSCMGCSRIHTWGCKHLVQDSRKRAVHHNMHYNNKGERKHCRTMKNSNGN